jgi:replication factor A1
VTLRSGKEARVADSTLEDETGTVKLSLWNEQIDEVKVGDRVRIENGYTNTFRGDLQLNVGYYGRLTKV